MAQLKQTDPRESEPPAIVELSPVEKNEIAKRIIETYPTTGRGKSIDRPLYAAIAIYVAEHPSCTTLQVSKQFSTNKHRLAAMGQVRVKLTRLAEDGVLSMSLGSVFVPGGPKFYDGKIVPGPGTPMKIEHRAEWSLGWDLTETHHKVL